MTARRTFFLIAAATSVAWGVLAAGASAQVTFSDDFNSGASALWENQRGNWVATGGVYNATLPSTSPLTYSSLPFQLSDFQLEVDINDVGDGGLWLRADAAGENGILLITGGLGWGANAGGGTSLYWHVISSGSISGIMNEAGNVFTDPGVQDVHLRVTVAGDLYSVFVNNSVTPATTLTNSDFVMGRVGLYDFSTQTLDNFQLVGVPEPGVGILCVATVVSALLVRARRRK